MRVKTKIKQLRDFKVCNIFGYYTAKNTVYSNIIYNNCGNVSSKQIS